MHLFETPLWASLLTVTGVWLVTVLSPGPNLLATLHAAVSHSRRSGVLVAGGIAVGTTLWAAASLLGLAVLFQSAGWLYHTIRFIGAGYLIYVGIRMVLAARQATPPTLAGTLAGRNPITGWAAFRRGLLTDLSNPKAAAFFTSLFAVAVPPAAPLWFDITIIAVVVAIAGGWYAVAACLIRTACLQALYRRAQKAIAYLAGTIFVGFGLRLAAER